MKSKLFVLTLLVVFAVAANAQEIITAESYLRSVSERYAGIRDYEAQVVIRSGSSEMTGNLSYLTPSFLRIYFTRPAGQEILFNGETMSVYLPEYRAVLNQNITPTRRSAASLASGEGLNLLSRNYVPSFVVGPGPVRLDDNSQEQVIKIRLTRRSISEGFREIILSITPSTKLIRRIQGRTITEGLVQFDFYNVRTNLGIPMTRFQVDSLESASARASAYVYNNFLFRDSE